MQAARADGFPWGSWAGSLNLFVWLVVGVYLVWGCRDALPAARPRRAAARRRRCSRSPASRAGPRPTGRARYRPSSSSLHVGLVLAAFAGFTLAAALSALYLWQERRLKTARAGDPARRAPVARRAGRARGADDPRRAAGAAAGIAAGIVRLRAHGGGDRRADGGDARDLGGLRGVRRPALRAGWRGRRAAYLALVGFAFVVSPAARPPEVALLDERSTLVGTLAPARTPIELRERSPSSPRRRRRRSRPSWPAARARRSASRPATAPSSTSSATTPSAARSRAARARGLPEETHAHRLPALRRGGGAASVPRRGRARLARSRRGRDPRPGAGRLRGGRGRAGARPALPPGAARGQEGAHGDRDRREPGVGVVGGAAALAQQVFGDSPGSRVLIVGAGKVSELAARSLAVARRVDRLRRQPDGRPRRPSLRRGSARRRCRSSGPARARRRRRRRLLDERARRPSDRGRRARPRSAGARDGRCS